MPPLKKSGGIIFSRLYERELHIVCPLPNVRNGTHSGLMILRLFCRQSETSDFILFIRNIVYLCGIL